jgi:Arc/MetJ-type ribon-helix-helix transcriptional regulator
MGMVQLPDELQSLIERQVAEGRAVSAAAFLEEAVMRLVDEAAAEEDELRLVVEAGAGDIESGRYTMVETPGDSRDLQDRLMARLRARVSAGC